MSEVIELSLQELTQAVGVYVGDRYGLKGVPVRIEFVGEVEGGEEKIQVLDFWCKVTPFEGE